MTVGGDVGDEPSPETDSFYEFNVSTVYYGSFYFFYTPYVPYHLFYFTLLPLSCLFIFLFSISLVLSIVSCECWRARDDEFWATGDVELFWSRRELLREV